MNEELKSTRVEIVNEHLTLSYHSAILVSTRVEIVNEHLTEERRKNREYLRE